MHSDWRGTTWRGGQARSLEFDFEDLDEREEVRKIAAHPNTASDLNTFTDTFLDNMRMMKFVMTITLLCDQLVEVW